MIYYVKQLIKLNYLINYFALIKTVIEIASLVLLILFKVHTKHLNAQEFWMYG